MDTRRSMLALATIGLAAAAGRPLSGQETPAEPNTLAFRILKWSPSDQTSWIKAALDKGMPPDLSGVLNMLILNKSALTLPLMGQKIEQVLHSQSPADCFTDKSVDPAKFVHLSGVMIAYAGNDDAMGEIGKLIKVDEGRFGGLVERTLMAAATRGNPCNLAYRTLEMREPLVDARVSAWFRAQLADRTQPGMNEIRRWWAGAMVEKYGGVPTERQWAGDPFVSRLNPAEEPSLHKDIARLAIDLVQQHPKR